MTEPHCGRLDPHPPHEWRTHERLPRFRRIVTCPGVVRIEGGALDDETRQRIAEEVADERYADYWGEAS